MTKLIVVSFFGQIDLNDLIIGSILSPNEAVCIQFCLIKLEGGEGGETGEGIGDDLGIRKSLGPP